MPPKKIAFWILLCIGLGLVLVVVLFIHTVIQDNKDALKYQAINKVSNSDSTNALYDKDLYLPKSYSLVMTMNSKTRQPIEVFKVDTTSFCFVYQLPVKSTAMIPEILTVQHESISPESGVGYYDLTFPVVLRKSKYEISYKVGAVAVGTRVNLKIDAENLKLVEKSDTVCQYKGQFKNFGVSYTATGNADFIGYIKPKFEYTDSLPIDITLKKVDNRYYLLINITNDFN